MSEALALRSGLEGLELAKSPRFALAEAAAAARFAFRGGEAARAATAVAFAVAPPARLGPVSRLANRAALWLGPDEWLLIAEAEPQASLGAALEAALARLPHSLVDVSHRQIGLVVAGDVAARALSAGCPLDLHASAFPPGFAARTMLDRIEITLWRLDSATFHVEVGRSFAPWAAAFLAEAARRAPD